MTGKEFRGFQSDYDDHGQQDRTPIKTAKEVEYENDVANWTANTVSRRALEDSTTKRREREEYCRPY